jgi:hypothetical protein
MTRARTAKLAAMLGLALMAGTAPAALSDPGGTVATTGSGTGPSAASPGYPAAAQNGSAAAPTNPGRTGGATAGDGGTEGSLRVSPGGALLGRAVRFRGALGSARAGREVQIERYSPTARSWVTTARARTDEQGSFLARWRANEAGRFRVRAVIGGDTARQAQGSLGPTTTLVVYRPGLATWFGPGFYGRRTACGEVLTHRLLGVASRTLPCGTRVEIRYHRHTLTVPVVDRGPYGAASWDLTWAAARALGFTGRDWLGTLRLT